MEWQPRLPGSNDRFESERDEYLYLLALDARFRMAGDPRSPTGRFSAAWLGTDDVRALSSAYSTEYQAFPQLRHF
jgi:hypothetical protein